MAQSKNIKELFDLKDQVALVSGSAMGIGYDIEHVVVGLVLARVPASYTPPSRSTLPADINARSVPCCMRDGHLLATAHSFPSM